MQKSTFSALILCNFHVYKWEKAYIKDLKCLKIFNEFFYVFI